MKFTRGWSVIIVAFACLASAALAVANDAKPVDVQPGDLADALDALARQCNVDVIYPSSQVRGLRTNGVSGNFDTATAFRKLIEGTSLLLQQEGTTVLIMLPSSPRSAVKEERLSTQPENRADTRDDLQPAAGGNSSSQLEEVTVTALRRPVRLQDAPASLSAIDRTSLRNMGASDYRSYLMTVPGVSYADNGPRFSRIIIRGVSPGFLPTTLSTVGVYVDEAPVTEVTSRTFDPSLYDVERIEVLRGPQGTLYGSGSQGGTIRVILNKPRFNIWEGEMQGSVGNVGDGDPSYKVDGLVNVPLIDDRLATRFSAGYDRKGGFIDNGSLGLNDVNDTTRRSARAAVRARIGWQTNLTASALLQREDIGAASYEDLHGPEYMSSRPYRENGTNDARLFSVTLDHTGDRANVLITTNYLRKDSLSRTDISATFIPVLASIADIPPPFGRGIGILDDSHYTAFTQEARLSSAGEGRFQWLLGAFHSQFDATLEQSSDLSRAPEFSSFYPDGRAVYTYRSADRRRQVAGFGELTYNASERLAFTIGLRSAGNTQNNITTSDGVLNGGPTLKSNRSESSVLTQKYLVSFKVRPQNLLYATIADGFRDGSGLPPIPAACLTALAQFGRSAAPTQFDPDTLWSYELGSKNTFANGRVMFNAAAYFIDWRDIQSTLTLPACFFQTVLNAGRAEIHGAELEAKLHPFTGLTVGIAAGYTDSKLTEPAAGLGPAYRDNPLPLVPKTMLNLNAQSDFPITGVLSGYARADASWIDERWTDYRGNTQARLLPDYALVNARIGVRWGKWDVALYSTNLLNRHVVANIPFVAEKYNVVLDPRIVGLTVRFEF